MAGVTLQSTRKDQFDYPETKLWTINASTNAHTHHEPPPPYVTTFGKKGDLVNSEYSAPAHGSHGIGVYIATVFILGEMAGGGVIAMPFAMEQAGWGGIAINILGAVVSCYTGFQLGWCWAILQENWPEYLQQTRKPYPEIGYRAGGILVKYFCQFCVNFTVFGTAVAFLVLASQNISSLIFQWFGWDVNYCYMILIVAAFLWPFTMLGTPKDFWPMAVGAILATTLAVCLIVVGTGIDAPTCAKKITYPTPTFVTFIQAYGTIAFAYGGHSAFPTIQHDMKRPALFPKSVFYAYIIVFLLYFPMPMFAYGVYGGNVLSPVYLSISNDALRDIITVLVTGHVMFAFFIFMNPISQDLEDILGVPTTFTWKRVCTRTFMVGITTFIALSVPDFGTLLNLIGGTTIAAMTFTCPGPFYMLLRHKTAKRVVPGSEKQKFSLFDHHSVYGSQIAWWEWIVNGIVVLVGVFGGAATIYGVIATWTDLSPPCYMPSVGMNGAVEGLNPNHTYCYNDNYDASISI